MTRALARRAPAGGLVNLSGATTTRELVGAWLNGRSRHTRRAYLADLAWWAAELGHALEVRWLTVADVVRVLEVERPAVAPRTMERRLASLRSLLAYAHQTGYCAHDIGPAVRSVGTPSDLAERILEPEQVASLIAAARLTRNPARDRLLVRLLYLSGARVAEILGVEWKHVRKRGDRAMMTVIGKGNRTRTIALPPGIAGELAAYREQRGGRGARGFVFRSRTGKRLSERDVQRLFKRLAKGAVVDGRVSPHWFRHSHATHALERGAPIHVVAATLGHRDVSTTTRYLHARPSQSSADWLG